MKSLNEIEKMSLEELESVSLDGSVSVPEGFKERIQESLAAQRMIDDIGNESHAGRFVKAAGVAASAALLVGLGYGIARWQSEPKDTFDDPYMAYAELEKAFARISDGVNKGLAMAGESETVIDKVTSVFE